MARLALPLRSFIGVVRLAVRCCGLREGAGVGGGVLDIEHGVVVSERGGFAVGVEVEEGEEEGGESVVGLLEREVVWLGGERVMGSGGVRTYSPVTMKAVRAL